MCWLWLRLTGIQCPAPLSPVTRPQWATAKASSSTNNGSGLYTGLEQTADCLLVLIHLYSVRSHCCRLSLNHTHTRQSPSPNSMVVCRRKRKFTGPYVGMYTDETVPLFFCLFLSLLTPPLFSLYSSIPLSPKPGPLHPLALFTFFLFVLHADSVARSAVGPNSQSNPQIASDAHLPPRALPPSFLSPTACVWAAPAVCFLHYLPATDHV